MKFCTVAGCKKVSELKSGLCQMHNWRLVVHGDVNYVPYKPTLCLLRGCNNKHKGHGLCQKHLVRKRRGLPMFGVLRTLHPKRYKLITKPQHPLAMKNGRVYVHRMVLYDEVEGSRLPCFWCGAPLEWKVNLHVDHRNHDRHNNSPTNLVPSCNSCNAGRMLIGSIKRVSIYTRRS